jgi:hypothetical protein
MMMNEICLLKALSGIFAYDTQNLLKLMRNLKEALSERLDYF